MAKENKKRNNDTATEDSPEKKAEKAEPKDKSTKGDKVKKDGIHELTEQLASEKDRVLRLSAEFENYKKRKQREIDDFKKFANEMIFRQLLTIVDNFERAIFSAEENPDEASLLEGVKMIHKETLKLLETFNVKPVDAEKMTFDPNFHQAVTQEETDEFPENTVSKVLQKGYLLHDRLIRPAMVVVSKRVEKETEEIKEN
ncbi:MAG: nucleotide exchange factor GrpE [Proteobacteria bacterium]|nr:nucleotide exchange factor GrpE [Pseudomonadota bacterium]MBU1585914.1 nucleotide exchange factor GrpE [Pseudomonadota bacterium]MBU2627107.1 nucleotide exchange factor GrpE [Pseudomonadota bacterium]